MARSFFAIIDAPYINTFTKRQTSQPWIVGGGGVLTNAYVLPECYLNGAWIYYRYCLNTPWKYSLNTVWKLSAYFLNSAWMPPEHNLNIGWIWPEWSLTHSLNTTRILPAYYLDTTWLLCEYCLELFRRLNIAGYVFVGREEVFTDASLVVQSLSETIVSHYTCTAGKRQMSQPWVVVEIFQILRIRVMKI